MKSFITLFEIKCKHLDKTNLSSATISSEETLIKDSFCNFWLKRKNELSFCDRALSVAAGDYKSLDNYVKQIA